MFTVEIKINGSLVANITGLNVTNDITLSTEDTYDYEVYETPGRDALSRLNDGVLKVGTVKHGRGDGIMKLVKKILNDKGA